MSLPHILRKDEFIQSLSLGAGNTGRSFDLETNQRIAEFKFINWKGGSEPARQDSLFKDFYLLAEAQTSKQRYIYVTGIEHPLKFLEGQRAISSVMNRYKTLYDEFQSNYGTRFTTVHEYYQYHKSRISLVDITTLVPQLSSIIHFGNTNHD